MRFFPRFPRVLTILPIVFPVAGAGQGMSPSQNAAGPAMQAMMTVSGDSVDRLRLAQLAGSAPLEGMMLRSTSTLSDSRRTGSPRRMFTMVLPEITFVNNSQLPFGQNDGALWAGVGPNLRALAGFTVSAGPLRLVAIPEFVYSANHPLTISVDDTLLFAPNPQPFWSHYATPWNIRAPYPIDMPYRFGDQPITKVYPGQSSLTLTGGPAEIGLASENEWWGPAIRNPVIMSDNAPGVPHLFLRTSHPVNTVLGRLDARWILGGLHKSNFFNASVSNRIRSLSAVALTWTPSETSGLALGFTRTVFGHVSGYGDVASHFFDALKNIGHPAAVSIDDRTTTQGSDQLFSLFARWALPSYGLESYVEWGRADFPVSLRDFLDEPNHSRGYTAGLQWVRSVGPNSRFRVQGEVTNLEQTSTVYFRGETSFYTSRSVIHGYTNEGQIIGAGLGPGSSAQWIAVDYMMRSGFQLGLNAGRTRFNNDAYFLMPFEVDYARLCGHDVTMYPGIRTGYSNSRFRIRADFMPTSRYNSFFKNRVACNGGAGSDRSNKNLTVTLTTFAW